jgi:hypothetical protein
VKSLVLYIFILHACYGLIAIGKQSSKELELLLLLLNLLHEIYNYILPSLYTDPDDFRMKHELYSLQKLKRM